MRVLVTGGAGFIGSHVADELIAAGHSVVLLDNLDPQVHRDGESRPSYLNREAELIVGDARDEKALHSALKGADAVVHLAAAVGVGQSMYQIRHYVSTNELATATLLEALARRPVGRVVVASSMSIYGEGLMRDAEGRLYESAERSAARLQQGKWELVGRSGQPLTPIRTPEWKRPTLQSVYALCKYAQERMCLMTCQAYGIEAVALRLFNVYGPRQALSNPYTGVLAIFASRLLNRRPPLVYEDGRQRRDFLHVRDVARAFRAALEHHGVSGATFNIGSGASITVAQVAERLAHVMGRPSLEPQIIGRYRVGDIRHCFADTSLAEETLGFLAAVPFEDGIAELVDWVAGQVAVDQVESANEELVRRGLVA